MTEPAIVLAVVIVVISVLIFFRKKAVKPYAACLEEMMPFIKGKWLKKGCMIEGVYDDRQVRCFIKEKFILSCWLRIVIKMKPKSAMFGDEVIQEKETWIDARLVDSKMADKKPGLVCDGKKLVREAFALELVRLAQFCEKIEKEEIRL